MRHSATLASWWFVLGSGVYGGHQMTVVGPYPSKVVCEEATKSIDTAQAGGLFVAPKFVYLHCWDGGEEHR